MEQTIYFTRHGKLVPGDIFLSEIGRTELRSVADRLQKKGFNPEIAVTSPEIRCVESVAYFTDKAEVVREQMLEVSGTIDLLRRFRAARFLPRLFELAAGKDALVVSHDCVPSVLALCLAEMRGASIDWKDENLRFQTARLERGHGVLVTGSAYEFISP